MDYEDQLDRALERAPDVAEAGERFEVPEPEVRAEGNSTVWENFEATHDRLAREPDHVMRFLQSELGTSAGIDDRGRARFTGDFKRRRITAAVESYVEAFVTCSECGSPDTRLVDERGTTVLRCDACGAISPIPDL